MNELDIKLKELYDSGLNEELRSFEKKRKWIIYQEINLASISLIILLLLMFFKNDATSVIAITLIALVVVLVFFLVISIFDYRRKFKRDIIQTIIAAILPDWKFKPKSHIESLEYARSRLFDHGNTFYGKDLIYGTVGKTSFCMSKIEVEQYSSETNRGKSVFKGLFAYADFNKHIRERIYVLPNYSSNPFGKWISKIKEGSSKGGVVVLEDEEFERYFTVYSYNQIEARYILSPKVMNALLKLRKVYKRNIYITFFDSKIYIAIPDFFIHTELFNPEIWTSIDNFASLQRIFHWVTLMSFIVEEMNLNTRIWTKE